LGGKAAQTMYIHMNKCINTKKRLLLCNSINISELLLRSLIHFELILVQGERQGYSFSLPDADTVFPATFVEEASHSL
jgi:hypothetical protein